MKKILLSLLTVVLALPFVASAQEQPVEIRNTTIQKNGSQVTVTFEMLPQNVKSNYKAILTPIIYDGNNNWKAMEPVTLVGRNRNIYDQRTGDTAGKRHVVKSNARPIKYTGTIPAADWMQFVEVSVDQVLEGCCTMSDFLIRPVIEPKFLELTFEPFFRAKHFDYELTELEKYDLENPFLHPMEDYAKRYDILGSDRGKGTSSVIFEQGKDVIDMTRNENRVALDAIARAFDLIESDPNAILKHIVVAGYASPEGSLALNTRLGQNRAVAVKRFLQTRMDSPREHLFEIINGREDWQGLREMVDASSMPEKQEVLSVIDGYTMEQEIRKTRIKEINGGTTYKYMLENFYPELRRAGYVQVYYEIDRRASVATAVTDSQGRTTWVDPDSEANRAVTALNRGIDLMLDGNFVGAINTMEPFDEDPRSWNLIGVAYMMNGDYNKAEEYLRKAVTTTDPDAQLNLEQVQIAKEMNMTK